MAKQTFTTGQVLLASQLTSLQQTAMLGGAAQAKSASYTLVSADAGSAISMTSTSATTVTVNTGLFAAGDTVFIQNLGTGNLTITAGSATVASAGSLILPQNDAGILYFVSTSSSVFYDFIQVGAASPLTTKGDVYTFSTSDARLGVGANNSVLTADSAEATGLKWASASAAGSSYTLLNSGGTSLSGSTTTISSISGQEKLLILVNGASSTSASASFYMTINGDTGTKYDYSGGVIVAGSTYAASNFATYNGYGPNLPVGQMSAAAASATATSIAINGGTGTGGKQFQINNGAGAGGSNGQYLFWLQGVYQGTATISSLEFVTSGGTFDAGTIFVYGSAV